MGQIISVNVPRKLVERMEVLRQATGETRSKMVSRYIDRGLALDLAYLTLEARKPALVAGIPEVFRAALVEAERRLPLLVEAVNEQKQLTEGTNVISVNPSSGGGASGGHNERQG